MEFSVAQDARGVIAPHPLHPKSQTVIAGIINRFQQENPDIIVKQVPVEEDAYNTKIITLARSGS
ncbi:hypothetical protein V5G94_25280, partial [Citrobacter braakii]